VTIPMKVAIPVWEGKVSPVFDTASRVLVVEVQNRCEITRFEAFLEPGTTNGRCYFLRGLGVETLICGAVTKAVSRLLAGSGISVIAWVSGPVEDVLQAYLDGTLFQPRFLMPGCRHEHHRGRHDGKGRGCAKRSRTVQSEDR